ncbi:MAG TPA: aminopeptidase N, partial [Casimicrobium sp.]|nr:aminopeptidase N [Casimicrobium sp.]
MKHPENAVIRRGDYRAPGCWVDKVDLTFDLDPTCTRVTSVLTLRRNDAPNAADTFSLLGDGLTLESISLNGVALGADRYTAAANAITFGADTLCAAGKTATLTVVTTFNPSANLALEGLYVTNGTFCTQCEAE